MIQQQNQNIQVKNEVNDQTIITKPILIRAPFNFQNIKSVQKIITPQIINQIQIQNQNKITLSLQNKSFQFSLQKKKLIRPMQLFKIKKLINKKNGKMIKIIKETKNLQFIYDYEDLGDFISTAGNNLLYGKKKYKNEQNDILNQIKKTLMNKIIGFKNEKQQQNEQNISNGSLQILQNQKYLQLIQPISFLKSYNLAAPSCDMLSSKIKDLKQAIYSINIGYQDQIPVKFTHQIPKSLKQNSLYKKLVQYLQKRPCWLKNSLYYTLYQQGFKDKFSLSDFKNIIKYLCYTYRTGPWKHTLCHFGFNPKLQYRSLIYQSITIKIKQKQVQDYQKQIQEQVYDPTFKQISNRCVRSYQLCDINNRQIRQIVNGKMIVKQGQCSKDYGWLNAIQYAAIMKQMKKHIQQSSSITNKKQQ